MINFRKAKPNEANLISALAINSKAYWGYSIKFMEACKAELTHTPTELANEDYIYNVAVKGQSIIGFYKLEDICQDTIILEALFINPSMIGSGLGRALYEHAKQACLVKGALYIEVQSDPNAEGFYKALGLNVTGKTQSGSIAGRFLPTLRAAISHSS